MQGFEPWLDEVSLIPGQEWKEEIPKAVRSSDVVVVCLSNASTTRAGFVQKEIKYALDVADEQPENTIFLIPVKLEECKVPQRLERWQWVDLFENDGYDRLVKSLRIRAIQLNLRFHDTIGADPLEAKELVERYFMDIARPGHSFSSHHRQEILLSQICGCFYCLEFFYPNDIDGWTDEDEHGVGQTALCPKCGIDSVVGSHSGLPMTRDFLGLMHNYWFE